MSDEQKQADALIQSILSACAVIQAYVAKGGDCDPDMIRELKNADDTLYPVADSCRQALAQS